MLSKRNLLPPLDYLLAFESAANCQSFAGASRELNISETAISRKVTPTPPCSSDTHELALYRTLTLLPLPISRSRGHGLRLASYRSIFISMGASP